MDRAEYLQNRRLQGVNSQIRKEEDRLMSTQTRLFRLKQNFELKRQRHEKSVTRETDLMVQIQKKIGGLEEQAQSIRNGD